MARKGKKSGKSAKVALGPKPKGSTSDVRPTHMPGFRKPRVPRGRKPGIYNNMPAVHAVCSNLDPFCVHATGAKLFDGNATRALTYRCVDLYTVACNASGDSFNYVTMNPAKSFTGSTVTAGAVSAWNASANDTFFSQFNTGGGSWRVVSWGVRFFTTQSNTSAIGVVIFSETIGKDITGIVGQVAGSLANGVPSKSFPVRDAQITFVGRPSPSANDFVSAINSTDFNDWSGLMISVTGGTTGTVGTLERIVNYEWLPPAASAYIQLATTAAPDVPAIMTARNIAAGAMDSIRSVASVAETTKHMFDTASQAVTAVETIASSPFVRVVGRGLTMAAIL